VNRVRTTPSSHSCLYPKILLLRGSILQKVTELINPATVYWDEQLIKDIFWEEDARIILSLPIVEDAEDFLAWQPEPKGVFSVKSAYALGIEICNKETGADASTSCAASYNFE
jgi:hypothetical protein